MTIRVIFLVLLALFAQADRQPATGLLIANAQLIDGTGAAARRADVRVTGDTIAAVGEHLAPLPGDRIVDAAGKVLAPGFIDMHSHADRGIDETPDASTQVMQGITTAVVGQDGGSELPIADFYERIARLKPAINYATAVGHGTVRKLVMGGDYKRAATLAEIETMKVLVDRGMRDGAIGLSSGLEYDPGFYSKTDELIALGSVVAKYGGYYMSHVRNENEGAFDSWREAIEIGRRNNIPVEISHIKLGVKPVWGRAAEGLKILEDARRGGVKVMADWYPYTYWQSSMYVLIETRDFENRAAWEKGLDDIGGAQNVLITSYRPYPCVQRQDAGADRAVTRAERRDHGDRDDARGRTGHRRDRDLDVGGRSHHVREEPARADLLRRRPERPPSARIRNLPARARPLRARSRRLDAARRHRQDDRPLRRTARRRRSRHRRRRPESGPDDLRSRDHPGSRRPRQRRPGAGGRLLRDRERSGCAGQREDDRGEAGEGTEALFLVLGPWCLGLGPSVVLGPASVHSGPSTDQDPSPKHQGPSLTASLN